MGSKRQRRVAEQIHEILSELLTYQVADPRLQALTIMDVQIDRELMYATVSIFATLDEGESIQDTMQAVQHASGFLRRELAAQMRLQRTPELRFKWDDNIEYVDRINNLIDSLHVADQNDGTLPDDTA